MRTKKKHFLILDANILIDFYKCDRTIVKLICTYVGQIYLAEHARDIILRIHKVNPKYITANIVEKAFIRLGID